MNKRMTAMLAALAVLALLIVFDRPQAAADAGLAEPVVRTVRAPSTVAQAAPPSEAPASSPAFADDVIPDLFASAATPAAVAAKAPAAGEGEAPSPYTLLGFKEEDGVREAYLSHQGEVVVARAGAVLNQRYRVLALRQDEVDIRDNQSGASIRLGFGVEQ
ncbi:MAG: hypothetical protein ABIT83_16505 [Massilia sp.]